MNYDYFNFLKEFCGDVAHQLQEVHTSDPEAFLCFFRTYVKLLWILIACFFLSAWVITSSYQKKFRRFITCVLGSVLLTILINYEFFYDIYCMAYGYVQYRSTTLLILSELLVFCVMHRMVKKLLRICINIAILRRCDRNNIITNISDN